MKHKLSTINNQQSTISHNGFTLIEVLMALGIMGMLFTMFYQVYFTIMKSRERVDIKSGLNHQARSIMNRMARELSQAYMVDTDIDYPPIFKVEDSSFGEYSWDLIHFTSVSHTPIPEKGKEKKECDISEIGYYLKANDDGRRAGRLIRVEEPYLHKAVYGEEREVELTDNVMGLDFKLYNEREGESFNTWDTSQQEEGLEIPALVEINLALEDRSGKVNNFMTKVFLPLANVFYKIE